jgi:hypothetical protein
MAYKIDKIVEQDVPDLVDFFGRLYPDDPGQRKDKEELTWLLSDPDHPDEYHGFVARDENGKVAGLIGYTHSDYRFGEKLVSGAIPMAWVVAPEERGLLGVQLLLKVMRLGDFGFAIHGSESALNTYRAVKLQLVARAHIYSKVTSPVRFLLSERTLSPRTWIKSVYFAAGKRRPPKLKEFSLEPYRGEPGIHAEAGSDLAMVPTDKRNRWIRSCPFVECLQYSLVRKGTVLGTCTANLEKKESGKLHGKIVQLPYMGDDVEAYRAAICLLEQELRDRKCTFVSILANQSGLRKAARKQGYRISDHAEGTQIFVRDPKGVLGGTDLREWFLTYYESDKGYRII